MVVVRKDCDHFLWYNLTAMKNNTIKYSTPYQMKLPLQIETIIPVTDPVYTFSEVMDHIDLNQYFAEKGCETGRPRYDRVKLLKIVLFAFMEGGYETLRNIEKLCRVDIRYMWLLNEMSVPTFATFGNFVREELKDKIEDIFMDINRYIFQTEGVDLNHIYIDGTKIEANANRYTWVWKKTCQKNRDKTFGKITKLIEQINQEVLFYHAVQMETREEYSVNYVELLLKKYLEITGITPEGFVHGPGHRQSTEQKRYQELFSCLEKLKNYAKRIEICGESRNSYSKTDHDATFMRLKRDYMGNDQLLPAYNMQIGICDEYIAVMDAKQYASDMECFIPLMEKFKAQYGFYPQYPVADAGYGSFNNYLYCDEHGMEKYMKFTMFEKTVKDVKYRNNPYRAINFTRDKGGTLVCPNGKRFIFQKTVPVKGNRYGRTEEVYQCEDCRGCQHRRKCYKGLQGNRTIRLNRELTEIHHNVLENLQSVHGALLCMNRSIQAEGVFGIMKWDRAYKRAFRRGISYISLEFSLISCGFNLYKFHNKRMAGHIAA